MVTASNRTDVFDHNVIFENMLSVFYTLLLISVITYISHLNAISFKSSFNFVLIIFTKY